jgi:agmatine/peptidylarginine deiminase
MFVERGAGAQFGVGPDDTEPVFADYLGARHALWLKTSIAGDGTRGHVDDLARFAGRNVVGIAATDLVLDLGALHCMTQQEAG